MQNLQRRLLAGAAIAAVPLTLATGLAFAAGWIGPDRVSGGRVADALEYNSGPHAGYRRAHAKGLCVSGVFVANGAGADLSSATVFKPGRYPVLGRLSTAGGNPFAKDGRNVFRSLALQITAPDGEIWRMALDHTPIFPVATPEAFVEFQHASRPDPATGKPSPELMQAYLARHPETRAFQDYLARAPLPDSFATGTYYSINAFRFVSPAGVENLVRWSFTPEGPVNVLDKARLGELPRDFLFTEFLSRLQRGPVQWQMEVVTAAPGDVTDDATVLWPASRPTRVVGTLILSSATPEESGACRDITFDPTLLPRGVGLSDDPLLSARAAGYAASFRRRALEEPGASAVGRDGPGARS